MPGNAPGLTPVFVGIGSNLDDPVSQVARATAALGEIPDTHLVCVSSNYLSEPFGPVDQPDFVNAVAELATALDVTVLFRHLQEIERLHGRVRGERWGPRVIDLDLLVYGRQIVSEPDLTVPHPGIAERNFVLLPLQEIAPELEIPGLGRIAELVSAAGESRISRLD